MIVNGSISGVVSGSEHTVLSYTNSTGSVRYIRSIGLEGNAEASWTIYQNLSPIFKRKTTNALPDEQVSLFDLVLQPGDILDVKVIHNESFLAEFTADSIITETKEDTGIIIKNVYFFELQLKGIIQNITKLNGQLSKTRSLSGKIKNESILNGTLSTISNLNGVLINERKLIGAIKCG